MTSQSIKQLSIQLQQTAQLLIGTTKNPIGIATIAARCEDLAAKIKASALSDALFEVKNGPETIKHPEDNPVIQFNKSRRG